MMTQNVMPDVGSYLGCSGARKLASQVIKSENKFEKVMDQSLNTSKDVDTTEKPILNKEKAVDVKLHDEKIEKPVETKQIKETESINSDSETVELEETPTLEQTENNFLNMEQLISGLGTKVADAVKEVLNLTDEELSDAMEEIGMQMMDLLQPNNLKELILSVNGTKDVSELLTNEKLAMNFTKLSQDIENIDMEEEFGITKEEIDNILKAIPQMVVSQNVVGEEVSERKQMQEVEKPLGIEKEPIVEITIETKNPSDTLTQEDSSVLDNKEQPKERQTTNGTVVDAFVQNLAGVKVENVNQLSEQVSKLDQMREIVTQVVDKIKVIIKPEITSMEIQLNPENLGKINLSVVAKNGQLTATFVTENQLTKEAVESQLQTLKDNLNNQGVKVEAVEVTVSNFSFQQSMQTDSGSKQQKESSRRQINLSGADYSEDDFTEEDLLAAKVLAQNGGSVDYTA